MVSPRLFLTAVTLLAALPGGMSAAEYRGMTAGWPVYANGYYAANYPTSYGASPAYYVARPTVAAGYAPRSSGTMYVPARAAYANPSYFAAYGQSPVAYRPVTSAGYAPVSGGYAPPASPSTYYAPVTANYAPSNSYGATPAGLSSAGSEAAAYYGQPTSLNYVPPRFAYRTNYAPVPVYMYRPVTAYDPITAQPVTCLQASTATCCQPQRSRSCFSWLNPFSWFNQGSSCGRSCGSPPPTTAYCGTAASQCGQPYYPVQPVVPVTPTITLPPNAIPAVPSTTFPSTVIPNTAIPPAGTRVPPPPTGAAIPGTRTIISPADAPPRLPPGTTATPLPGTTFPPAGSFNPGGTITPLPSNPAPGTTVPPGGSFPTGPGAFGTGTNYPPATDPYSSSTMTPAIGSPQNGPSTGPSHSVFGSGYRDVEKKSNSSATAPNSNVIRAPDLGPAMPPSVQTVPDIDASRPPRPASSAPQLLNPRDKTAVGTDQRWAVVPAVWPTTTPANVSSQPAQQVSTTSAYAVEGPAPVNIPSLRYNDGGWKSAAF